MNAAHLHLMLNHLPILMPLIALPMLAAGLRFRSIELQKAGLCVLVLSGLFAGPVYLSGEPAEILVKNYPTVSRVFIRLHEKAAGFALVANALVGIFSLTLLIWLQKRRRVAFGVWILFFAIALWSSTVILRTAQLGGQIRHEELQGDFGQ